MSCTAGFICAYNKYLWTEEYVLVTVLQVKDTAVNVINKILAFKETKLQLGVKKLETKA